MSLVPVNVKWGREKYEVEVNPSEPTIVFKSKLYSLTNVVPERQKLIAKGITFGDESWEGITITPGMTFMLMGSVGEIPRVPVESIEVISTPEEKAREAKRIILPLGCNNLGNTCYLNSVLQVFHRLPELRRGIATPHVARDQMMFQVFKTFKEIDGLTRLTCAAPYMLLNNLMTEYPQFASVDANGPQQQDANEVFMALLEKMLRVTDGNPEPGKKPRCYFKGVFSTEMKCLESETEPSITSNEDFYQLSCFLSQEVKYIQTGIKNGLKTEISKNSPTLGRDVKWLKTELITRLPMYLPIQIVRFFYKEAIQTTAKILKDVKFPLVLDVFDFCSPELQNKLRPMRAAIKEQDDALIEIESKKKMMDKDEAAKLKDDGVLLPTEFPDDVGSNNSGFYDLKAVVTHKGRSVKSGHYVAWVRIRDQWVLCDDENISFCTAEDVLKTSGGGDWHTAYILLYESRQIKKYAKPETAAQSS
ncbi:unnamed protein product [Caenorhabditis auriculariae]|uniref:Ubiquitin carboxyl-terminal hydrolase 14 n=1 Tax=Caenorhabditis auriculariae TaxID=2777116 RepID=A0A8S1HXE0_9PELO|nr:unnamed protein product [Caenorhabditis auriculariae]